MTASLLSVLLSLGTHPALADGGRGGYQSYGGAGGTATNPDGETGKGLLFVGGSGGGGAMDVSTGNGGRGGDGGLGKGSDGDPIIPGVGGAGGSVGVSTSLASFVNSGDRQGGSGGNGGDGSGYPAGAGGGGGGGAGLFFQSTGTLENDSRIAGGAGGAGGIGGGSDDTYAGGGGGEGGAGVLAQGGAFTNSGQVTGGDGGAGGQESDNASAYNGAGGDGGAGVVFTGSGIVENTGTIAGGDAGLGGGVGGSGPHGVAGAAIVGSNLTVINGGTLQVGRDAGGNRSGAAIRFTGGTNRLELHAGSVIEGHVAADGTADTLALGGDADGSFDLGGIGAAAQYRGFEAFEKTGAGTWTLTGTANYDIATTVEEGRLQAGGANAFSVNSAFSVDSGATLALDGFDQIVGSLAGAGTVELGTNTLTTGGDDSSTTFSGGITGTGGLVKAGTGTLTVTGDNSGHTGGWVLEDGTLAVGHRDALGTGSLVVKGGTIAAAGNHLTLRNDLALDGDMAIDPGDFGEFDVFEFGDFTLAGDIDLGGATRTISNNGSFGTVHLDGEIADGGLSLQTDLSGFNAVFFDMSGTASNTYAGDTIVGDLVSLRLNKTGGGVAIAGDLIIEDNGVVTVEARSEQIADTATVTIEGTGRFNVGFLDPLGETIDTLADDGSGAGLVDLNENSGLLVTQGSFSGTIDGAGVLIKHGAGTLTLSGTNTYSGGTTVSGGTLIGDSDSLQGDIVNNAAIIFDQASDGAYDGVLSGTGSLTKSGAGLLTLTGDNTYTGPTTVAGGALAVDGSVVSAITVRSGATLKGTGSIGDVTLLTGATHAPGNSIGTQTVAGAYTLNAGSVLEVEVDDAGHADRVEVAGTVELGGADLRIVGLPGTYADGSYRHVIIANDGGDAVVGVFGEVDNRLAFYEAGVGYAGEDGNDVVLILDRSGATYTDIAATGNQTAAASALPGLTGADGQVIRDEVLGLTTAGARKAYEQLSGDVHAAVPQVSRLIDRQFHGHIDARLSSLRAARTPGGDQVAQFAMALSPQQIAGLAPDEPLLAATGLSGDGRADGLWVQALGGVGRIDSDGNAAATDYDWRGLMTGYDAALSPRLRLGVFLGYIDGETSQDDRDATVGTDSLTTGVYGDYLLDDWRLAAQVGWTRTAADSARTIVFGGLDRTARADYVDHALSAAVEVSRAVDISGPLRLEPYAGIGVSHRYYDGFDETGAGAADLSRESDTDLIGTATIGVRASGLWELANGWRLLPQARLGWEHHVGPTDNQADLAFAGSEPITVSGTAADRDRLVGNIGVTLLLDGGWSAYADYRPSLSENQREHSFAAGVKLTW